MAYLMLGISIFQFPPLREGRPAVAYLMLGISIFQFPPLREGRRCACG